jgi:N-acylglucosamine 2-epimerase
MDVLRKYRDVWRKDLLEGEAPFWLNNSIDTVHGGYFTCLDQNGKVYDDNKYLWLQGRSVFMFSRLYNEVQGIDADTRAKWLAAAAAGAVHLDKALDGNNLLFFSCTRDWIKLHYQRKPYSAVFYVLGFLEFYRAITRNEREGGAPIPGTVVGVGPRALCIW